jgi:Raf kinase inhibitor-like YbhB/YbcL family protein
MIQRGDWPASRDRSTGDKYMSCNRLVFACVLAGLAGCDDSNPKVVDSPPPAFKLESPDLAGGTFTTTQIANGFGCTGENHSPALTWSNPPAGTKSFVITVFDHDAPTGSGFWHWTVFNIPATTTSLASNAAATTGGSLPAGAIQGYTDFGAPGYGGPCPPEGDAPHHYEFKISALNVDKLEGLSSASPAALVTFSALGATLGTATFTATYGRGTPGTATHPEVPTLAGFTLASDDIPAGTIGNEQVLNTFGCMGDNLSPELHWTGAPAGTLSYALTVYDPDAPTGSGFWHWLAFDIPATTTSLAKGAGAANAALGGGVQGYNDTGANAYAGPCPPVGDPPHHYIFTIYAIPTVSLATTESLSAAAPGALIGFTTRASPHKATAKATFTALYGR